MARSLRWRRCAPLFRAILSLWALCAALFVQPAAAEDGYELWLRYHSLPAEQRARYAPATSQLVMPTPSPTLGAAKDELLRGLNGLLSQRPASVERVSASGLMVGTPQSNPQIARLDRGLEGPGRAGLCHSSSTGR